MIRIIIAEDQRMLRGALGALLDLEDDIEVVGQAENGEEALKLIETLQPDISIMDIEMPIQSGLDVAETLRKQQSLCRVMILTTFARPGYFERAMKANVHGYLLKDSPSEKEVLLLAKEGKTTNEIAQTLYLSSGTLRNYISDVLTKLDAKNRIEAITIAEEKGWI